MSARGSGCMGDQADIWADSRPRSQGRREKRAADCRPNLQVEGCHVVPCRLEQVQRQAAVHTAAQQHSDVERR